MDSGLIGVHTSVPTKSVPTIIVGMETTVTNALSVIHSN